MEKVMDGAIAPIAGGADAESGQYSDKLYNADLAPLSGTRQNWPWYNSFAFWM